MERRRVNEMCAALVALAFLAVTMSVSSSALAAQGGQSGATLQAYKTLDICDNGNGTWTYSGEVSVWNIGVNPAEGLKITDCLQYKGPNDKGQPTDIIGACQLDVQNNPPSGPLDTIPGLTQETDAFTFAYVSPFTTPLDLNGTVRNSAVLTITNHSGTRVDGPNPKATYTGTNPPPLCSAVTGCTLTQGYWKTHSNWPSPYDPNALFFISGQTWQQVLDTSVNVSQGYYQLAHQYIAAVLNQANGASVPAGVQTTLNNADTWLTNHIPADCTAAASCGEQKDWAKVLDDYNNGIYPGGPAHCGS